MKCHTKTKANNASSGGSERLKKGAYNAVIIAMFVAIIAVCSWITVPFPNVPFTLQLFGVFVALGILGGKRGTLTVFLYILLGSVGAPVFSSFNSGIAALVGPTGGYIVGFLVSALVYWLLTALIKTEKWWVKMLFMGVSLLFCYLFGTLWFAYAYAEKAGADGVLGVILMCVAPYVVPDAVKIVAAAKISDWAKKRNLLKN